MTKVVVMTPDLGSWTQQRTICQAPNSNILLILAFFVWFSYYLYVWMHLIIVCMSASVYSVLISSKLMLTLLFLSDISRQSSWPGQMYTESWLDT